MCTCKRTVFLVGAKYKTKKKEIMKIEMNRGFLFFFCHLECQNSKKKFFTAKTYIKQVYLEEGGQIRNIW